MVKDTSAQDLPLVERTLGGDLAAFEELVELYRLDVYRVAARIVGRDEADDVTQDAFLRAFHKLDTFRGESFRAWVLRITHNRALNVVARRKPEPVDPAEQQERQGDEAPARQDPARSLEASERRARLEVKLEELRPAHRSVLVLRDLAGFSYEEIAEITDSPLGTVKGRLHRAREELIEISGETPTTGRFRISIDPDGLSPAGSSSWRCSRCSGRRGSSRVQPAPTQ